MLEARPAIVLVTKTIRTEPLRWLAQDGRRLAGSRSVEGREGEHLGERYARALGYEDTEELIQALVADPEEVRSRHGEAVLAAVTRAGMGLLAGDDATVREAARKALRLGAGVYLGSVGAKTSEIADRFTSGNTVIMSFVRP